MTAILSSLVLIWRRIQSNWRLLLVVFAGILAATTLLAAAPLYLGATSELGLRHTFEYESAGVPDATVLLLYQPLDQSAYVHAQEQVSTHSEGIRHLVNDEVSHITTPTLRIAFPPGGIYGPNDARASINSFGGYEEHTDVIEGALPRSGGASLDGVIEVAIGLRSAQRFRIGVGDVVEVQPVAGDRSRIIQSRITGIVAPRPGSEAYWGVTISPFRPGVVSSGEDAIALLPLIIPVESFLGDVATLQGGMLVNYWWFMIVDPSLIDAQDASETREALTVLGDDLTQALPGASVLSGLDGTLDNFQDKLFFGRIPIMIMLILVMTILLYFLIMVANVVVDRHLGEIALFRSRGANSLQIMAVYLWEALLICAVAAGAGPLIAFGLVPLLGKASAFADVTGGATLPVDLNGAVFLFGLLGGGLSFLALAVPALRGARFNILSVRALSARPVRLLLFHRYYLDIFLFALTGLLYWELTQRGSLVTQRLFGSNSVDQVLLVTPVLFMLSTSLLLLRAAPLVLSILSWFAARTSRVWLAMGLWNLARNPVHYIRPVLLLMLVAAMAMFAVSYNSTLQQSFEDRSLYLSGADARLVSLPQNLSGDKDALAARFAAERGVEDAAAAYRFEPQSLSRNIPSADVLTFDPLEFNRISFFREDFSERDDFALLRHLDQGRFIVNGMDLPVGITSIGVWARPAREYTAMSLWVRIRDGAGQSRRFSLGRLDVQDWRFLSTDLTTFDGQALQEPLILESIYVWELDFPDGGGSQDTILPGFTSTGQVNLDDLTAFIQFRPAGIVIDSLESTEGWAAMATHALFQETFEVTNRVARNTSPTMQISWQALSGMGIRGIFPKDFPEELPVVVSERLLASTGRRIGDVITTPIAGIPVPVRIADAVAFYPTMDPTKPFILGNVESLLYYANLFRGSNKVVPNEVWLSLAENPEDRQAFIDQIAEGPYAPHLSLDRDENLAALNRDPLVGNGSEGIVFAVMLVLVVVSIGGYLGYFYVASYRTPLEFAVLRALGLTRGQLIAFQLLIHTSVVMGSVLLGAWIGSRAHSIAITFLQHTEEGRAVIPPFVPHTDWSGIGIILLATATAVVAIVAWAGWSYGRTPIWQVLRRGEGQ